MEGSGDQNQQLGFSIGQKGEIDTDKKNKDTADNRLQETLGIKDQDKTDDIKRKRYEYGVSLRQEKRDKLKKARRNIGQTNQQNNDQQSPFDMQDDQNGVSGSNVTGGINFETYSIEDALNYQKTSGVDLQNFTDGIANKMKFKISDFGQLCQLIYQEDNFQKLLACIGLRKLLSIENNPPIQAVIDANLVPTFIVLLHHTIPKFQFESAWCLTNIASGSTDHVTNLIEKDVLNHFIQLLDSQQLEVVEQVIWGIGNIAGDSPSTRDAVLKSGALDKIAYVLDNAVAGTSFMRNASWALSNLCRGRPQPQYGLVRRAVPTLIKVLVENDKEDIITDICWALSYLSDGAKERIDDLLDPALLQKMIKLLRHENVAIAIPCLRTIGNIVTGDDSQTQMAVDSGLVDALNVIICHTKKTVRKESCWVLSNITAGTPEQVQSCIDIGIVDKLVSILKTDDVTVKNEAVWALSNCTASATPAQFEIFVQKGMINALGEMFKCKDVRMLAVALEGIENILACGQANFLNGEGDNTFAIQMEQAGCLDDLEALQAHPNHQIYKQALAIIEKYFADDENANPLIQTINNVQAQNPGAADPTTIQGGLFDL